MEGCYPTKKALKESVGKPLNYRETSIFGEEYRDNGVLTLEGPAYKPHNWYARVTMENGIIKKVQ